MENSIAEFKRELFPKNESGIETGIETHIADIYKINFANFVLVWQI